MKYIKRIISDCFQNSVYYCLYLLRCCFNVLTLLFISVIICLTITQSYASQPGNIIKKIEVSGLDRISREEFIYLMGVEVGQQIDRKQLSRGIRRVFRKGFFLDIQAVTKPVESGTNLKFLVREIPVIKKISFEGIRNISKGNIKKEFIFKKGEYFREEQVEKARSKLIAYYNKRGYPDTNLKIFTEGAKEHDAVNMRVVINQGQPLIVNNINLPEDTETFIRIIRGDVFDKEKLDKDLEKLRVHYKKMNYLNPRIGPYRFVEGNLDIPANFGPRLHISFKNNTVFTSKKLEVKVPFLENEEVTDESISETVSRIKTLYLEKGYYYARIAAGVERDEHIVKVTFVIFEGEKVLLKKIEFTGISVEYESLKTLTAFKEGKPYNDNLLNKSKEDLARFYNALGYLDFEVKGVKKQFNVDGSEISLEIDIYEGPRTIIESIVVKGNNKLSESRIMNAIQIKAGDPYNVIDISDARYRVLSLYRSQGYIDANVDVKNELNGEKAYVTFTVTEYKPSQIGKIIIRGNRLTKTNIIRREFTIKEGDSYNQREIARVRQRLYKLGIFSEVTINTIDADLENNDKNVRDILVSLKEGKAGTVEISAGYSDYEELRGSFDISYRNLGGYNRQVGFRTELSAVEERYVLNFVEPWFFDMRNLPLKMFLMREITRSVNVETRDLIYKIDKFSFIAGFEKELINDLRVGLNYEYSFTDTSDVQPGIILSKEDSGTLGIGSVSPSIFYDNRDDPFDPSSGSLHGIVMKFASQVFLSETEFMKGSFQSSWYFQTYKDIVFAFSIKVGGAYSFEGSNEVPLIERYFLGGRSTVRGYSNDALGPKDADSNPTGGNIFALTNMEFRIPFWKGLGVVAFLDSGNVWKTANQIEPDFKHTIGGGIRYATPVGPVRVDYGYKLSRESDESVGELHFSFGHAF